MASDSSFMNSLQDESKEFIIENAVNFCTEQIRNWNRKRAPPALGKKLARTHATESTSTARIFLQHGGFVAWLAYNLATEGKAHFQGRLKRHNIMQRFRTLPFDYRVGAARRVADFAIPVAVSEHILAIHKGLENNGVATNSLGSNKIAEPNAVLSVISATYTNNINPIETHTAPNAVTETFSTSPSLTTRRNQTVINASLNGLADVFGEYMCRAIRKVPAQTGGIPSLKAAVTMEFPDFVLVDCVMMLE
ncbi:hypothetical protein AJ80_10085, partial [Polytolypa hystricis UAMH7299]